MEADWNLTEAIEYYRGQNVSQDQQALIELLREVQAENGGSIPACALEEITAQLDIRTDGNSQTLSRPSNSNCTAQP